jgi:hypothetical protein
LGHSARYEKSKVDYRLYDDNDYSSYVVGADTRSARKEKRDDSY